MKLDIRNILIVSLLFILAACNTNQPAPTPVATGNEPLDKFLRGEVVSVQFTGDALEAMSPIAAMSVDQDDDGTAYVGFTVELSDARLFIYSEPFGQFLIDFGNDFVHVDANNYQFNGNTIMAFAESNFDLNTMSPDARVRNGVTVTVNIIGAAPMLNGDPDNYMIVVTPENRLEEIPNLFRPDADRWFYSNGTNAGLLQAFAEDMVETSYGSNVFNLDVEIVTANAMAASGE